VDEVGRQLISQLDGSRDRQALRKILVDLVTNGDLDVNKMGSQSGMRRKSASLPTKTVEQQLAEIGRHALLVG